MNFAFFLHYLKENTHAMENVSNSIQGAGLFPHPFISVCRKDSASRRRHNIIFSRKHLQVTYFSNTFGDELREGKPYKGQHVQ